MDLEIEHLLEFVARSGCQFNRNNTWHDSPEASAHLAKKERYLATDGAASMAALVSEA